MIPEPAEQPDARLEAYLDGGLSADERAAFERDLAADPALADAVALQARIDDSLQRQFGASGLSVPPLRDAGAAPAGRRPRAWWRAPGGIAAAVLLSAVGVWSILALTRGAESLAAVYQNEIDGGLVPGWVCETDEEFAQAYDDTFRQPLLLAAAPGVEALGLSYNYALSARTVMLLTRVDGEPVLVFAGPTRLVKNAPESGSGALNVFERTIGQVRLFELTPFEAPRVLPAFYAADDDAE